MSVGEASPGLAEVAAELYGLPLAQFTARRNERARQARAAGDREVSDRIKGLRRPTVVAWLANQLVRAHPDEVQPLLALGEALRQATANLDGDQLRQLSRQQWQLISALVGQARALASAAGQPVSEDTERGLRETLRAVLADPDAAAAFAQGQLTSELTPPAFGAMPSVAAQPVPNSSDGEPTGLDQARADLDSAEAAAAQAHTALRQADAAAARADDRARRAAEQVQRLREQLDSAISAQSQADTEARESQAVRDRAERDVRDAQQQLRLAQTRLDALERSHTRTAQR